MGTVPHRQTVGEVIIIYEDRKGGKYQEVGYWLLIIRSCLENNPRRRGPRESSELGEDHHNQEFSFWLDDDRWSNSLTRHRKH